MAWPIVKQYTCMLYVNRSHFSPNQNYYKIRIQCVRIVLITFIILMVTHWGKELHICTFTSSLVMTFELKFSLSSITFRSVLGLSVLLNQALVSTSHGSVVLLETSCITRHTQWLGVLNIGCRLLGVHCSVMRNSLVPGFLSETA